MARSFQPVVLAVALVALACGQAPAAGQPSSAVPTTQSPAAPAAPAAGSSAAPAAGGTPAAPPACGGASQAKVDADVQQAYDQVVKQEMPGVPIELVQTAKQEGTVVFYHLVNPANPPLVQAFQKAFPFVKVQEQQLNGGPLVEKFATESRTGQHLADVAQFSSLGAAKKMQEQGFVMQYHVAPEAELPKDQGLPGYVVPVASTIQIAAYNPERIKDDDAKVLRQWQGLFDPRWDLPRSRRMVNALQRQWQGLFDPRWDGKRFGVADIRSGGTHQTTNYFFLKTFGTKLWDRIAQSGYLVYPGVNPMFDSIVAGETDLAVGGSVSAAVARWKKGAPIHWQYPEPHVALPYAQFINANAPHPSAAKLFQEFAMSVPGQQVFLRTGSHSYRKGLKETGKYASEPWYDPPDPAKYWQYSHDELAAATPDLIKRWEAVFKK